ncbi:MAG: hypothetical protein E6H08_11685 [Bacteroidetes bacterium]|jgi:hypothetical protein|nr:MAG: hypothetical protein E6H08_11685 [Bacteroidota bacterium]
MQELRTLDNTQLIDLLAQYTSDYTKMISENMMGDDYEKCKLTIKAIQTEIDVRKTNGGNISAESSMTRPPDFS